jgi:hypothetical protein
MGGNDGLGWPFGQDINSGAIAYLLGEIPGVEQVEEVVLFEADLRNGTRLGAGTDTIRVDPYGLPLSYKPQVVAR